MVWGALKLPQRVRAEPGHQTQSGAFLFASPAFCEVNHNSEINVMMDVNPFKPSGAKWLHYLYYITLILHYTTYIFFDVRALWRSLLSARVPERQKKIKMVG